MMTDTTTTSNEAIVNTLSIVARTNQAGHGTKVHPDSEAVATFADMEQRGLVERLRNAADERVNGYWITAAGMRAADSNIAQALEAATNG